MFATAPICILDLAPKRLAGVRRQANLLSITAMAAAEPVWLRVIERNIPRGLPTLHFPNGAEDGIFAGPGIEVEYGFEIFEPFDDPTLQMIDLPGGRAAFGAHPGSHDGIARMHRAIRRFCEGRNERLAGPVIERHHWHEDVERRLTEVYYLLA